MFVKRVRVSFRAAGLVAFSVVMLLCYRSGEAGQDTLDLAPGQQHVLAFPKPLEKVAVSDPDVASVQVSGDQEVLITAEAAGEATVRVWLEGQSHSRRTDLIVTSLGGRSMPVPMQVQTDIRMVEVSREKLNSLGFYYAKVFNGGNSGIGISSSGADFVSPGGVPDSLSGISSSGFNLFAFGSSSLSIINALESSGFAYTLAEPSLVSLSGQSASFLSGGEFPVPVSGSDGETEIEYKSFGVSLSLTPTVISEKQIILKVAPEVSDLDYSSGVVSGGVSVPGISVRRTETMVSMAPGESFIISGLVSRSTYRASERLPGLGSLPVLGALFRSEYVSDEEQELIMVVTPRLVAAVPELPEDVRNFGRKYEYGSTEWGDMVISTGAGTEPVESGLSW